jgi:hypothetical protein
MGFFLMNYVNMGEALTIPIVFESVVETKVLHIDLHLMCVLTNLNKFIHIELCPLSRVDEF